MPIEKPLSLTTRVAMAGDIPRIVQLVQWAYRGGKPTKNQWTGEEHLVAGPRTTPEKLATLLSKADCAILLCESTTAAGGTEIVGSIHVEKAGDDAHIAMLAVDPELQTSGVGRLLMQAAEDRARSLYGCTRMAGEVVSGRPELMSWYQRLGYRETGETAPFFGPEHGVMPLVDGLHFVLIEKLLCS
jgi:ribosomal protein S18 acetylase RimI-like enzyme